MSTAQKVQDLHYVLRFVKVKQQTLCIKSDNFFDKSVLLSSASTYFLDFHWSSNIPCPSTFINFLENDNAIQFSSDKIEQFSYSNSL